MILSLLLQFEIIFFSLLAGIITGVLFDCYRIFRGLSTNKVLVIIQDILFWILCSLIIFIFLLYNNNAFVGVYVYIYIAIGIYMYLALISRHFLKIQYTILRTSNKIIRILFNFISYPIKLLFYNKNKEKS